MKTRVSGPLVNFAVCTGTPRIVTFIPIEPSVEPMASTSTACGMRSSIASFTSAVHMTPEEMTIFTDDVS